MDKNSPANAGYMGSIPGPGRFHMPQSNWAHAPQLLSLRAATTEARAPRACALLSREATAMRSPSIATREEPLLTTTRESLCSDEDPAQQKKKIKIYIYIHTYIWRVNGE